jgi:hypothetical protein
MRLAGGALAVILELHRLTMEHGDVTPEISVVNGSAYWLAAGG